MDQDIHGSFGAPFPRRQRRGSIEISDLSPLEGMKFATLMIKPEKIVKGMNVLRQMSTLTLIDAFYMGKHENLSPDDFRKRYDAKELKQ